MKTRLKKALCLALVLVMAIGAIPFSASAAGVTITDDAATQETDAYKFDISETVGGVIEFTEEGLSLKSAADGNKSIARVWLKTPVSLEDITVASADKTINAEGNYGGINLTGYLDGTSGYFNLVYEPEVYAEGSQWWCTNTTAQEAMSSFHFDLDDFKAKYPSATIFAIGFAGNYDAGKPFDGVIKSLTLNDTTYTFTLAEEEEPPAAPPASSWTEPVVDTDITDPETPLAEDPTTEDPVTLPEAYAQELNALGLFLGTGDDEEGSPVFELDQPLTRIQALVLTIRLLGIEEEALAFEGDNPFADAAEWSVPYVAFAFDAGITNGTSETTFTPDAYVSFMEFSAFLLRSLGYDEELGDFAFVDTLAFALEAGLYDEALSEELDTLPFLRGSSVVAMVNALQTYIKDSDEIMLLDTLVEGGVLTQEAADAFMEAIADADTAAAAEEADPADETEE